MPVSPLLAFGFATPWLLWGLALGSLPIIIHLLHKRRFRETSWAAMRFLIEATRKNSRRLRLEQLLLLAVRVLILLLLATALAQPYVETFGTFFTADVPTHRILVLDASLSMGYQPSELSRFDRAKGTARQIVSSARQGDALNLVRIAGSEPRAVVRRPAYQRNQVISEIDQLKLTHERGDLLATLKEVEELLTKAPEVPRKEIYFLTDFQRTGWAPESGVERGQFRQTLKRLGERAELTFIDLGQTGASNAAVTSFAAEEPFVIVGRPVRLQGTLRNFGGSPLAGQLVELYVDGRLAESQRVDLAAGGETRVEFSYTFSASGEQRLELRLEGDALAADNHRWLALPVRDELKVLLVNGRQAGRPEENATYFLERALSPATARGAWQGFVRPRVIAEGELAGTDLSRYDAVFLCNIGLFTGREESILRTYVESGGGLVFFLGNQVRPENYNNVLYRDGQGILPARLTGRVGNARSPSELFEFDPGDLSHPIVSAFRGNPGTGLETTLTFEYLRAELAPDSLASVALRFTSGDPAIIDAPVGRGRVIVMTTSADVAWGTWPIQRSFPPMVHETVSHAVSGRWSERQRLVGEPLDRAFPTRVFGMPVTVKRPDGRSEPVPLAESENSAAMTYETTDRSGMYETQFGPPLGRSELFAVNIDTRESDLAKLDEQELRADLLPETDFLYRTRWEDVTREAEVTVAERGGLTRWLLLAALALLLVELLMAWNFLYGLTLLCGVTTAALLRPLFTWSPPVAVLTILILLAALLIFTTLSRRATN